MLSAVPDRRRRLGDGTLVEASILARVLGVRVLTLATTVVLVPADICDSSSAPHPSTRSALAPMRSGVAGHGLAEAQQSLAEGAELLATARRNGSSAA